MAKKFTSTKKPLKKSDFLKLSPSGKKAVSKLAKKTKTRRTKRRY